MAKKQNSAFLDWLDSFGQARLAEELGITKQAVNNWRRGRSQPNPLMAHKIVEQAAGVLSLSDIRPDIFYD